MHELSLMQGIFDSVSKVAAQHNAQEVTLIELDIGEMTQVVDEALQFAFEVLQEDLPLYRNCELKVNYIPVRSKCIECEEEFEHDQFHLKCPKCGSAKTVCLAGKEMNIACIEIEDGSGTNHT
ncbi:MAG: hydrogenase maturation nickel metallochaperone HypA [Coriobacteriales bacterium]|nr:hydrogenase maturation nickel metallochaperone HypA [Coriobacteriales bacterium]